MRLAPGTIKSGEQGPKDTRFAGFYTARERLRQVRLSHTLPAFTISSLAAKAENAGS